MTWIFIFWNMNKCLFILGKGDKASNVSKAPGFILLWNINICFQAVKSGVLTIFCYLFTLKTCPLTHVAVFIAQKAITFWNMKIFILLPSWFLFNFLLNSLSLVIWICRSSPYILIQVFVTFCSIPLFYILTYFVFP